MCARAASGVLCDFPVCRGCVCVQICKQHPVCRERSTWGLMDVAGGCVCGLL